MTMTKEKRQFDNDKIPYKEKEVRPEKPGICADFMEGQAEFGWFIEKYFGKQKLVEMKEMARKGEEDRLKTECNDIWFRLPDSIFNVRERPRGWMLFLRLVEED